MSSQAVVLVSAGVFDDRPDGFGYASVLSRFTEDGRPAKHDAAAHLRLCVER